MHLESINNTRGPDALLRWLTSSTVGSAVRDDGCVGAAELPAARE